MPDGYDLGQNGDGDFFGIVITYLKTDWSIHSTERFLTNSICTQVRKGGLAVVVTSNHPNRIKPLCGQKWRIPENGAPRGFEPRS